MIGDPLMTVPILVPESDLAQLGDGGSERVSLCYEIHGRPREYFNFVTDVCASVNVHYVNITRYLNVIDRVGIVQLGEYVCMHGREALKGATDAGYSKASEAM